MCDDPVALMQTHIEWNEVESLQMFSGFRGSGKTTELFRLKQQLEDSGYIVLYADALEYINPSEKIDITDLLIVLAGAYSAALENELKVDIAGESYWERFKNYLLNTQVDIPEASVKTEIENPLREVVGGLKAGLDLKLTLRSTPSFREKLQQGLINRIGEPSVRQWNNDDERSEYGPGWDSLRALARKRFGEGGCKRVFGEPDANGHFPLADKIVGLCGGHFRDLLLLFREMFGEATCISGLGNIALNDSDLSKAQKHYEEAYSLYRNTDSLLGQANCLQNLGNIAGLHRDYDAAQQQFETALTIYRHIQLQSDVAKCLMRIGDIRIYRSDYYDAKRRYKEALKIYQQIDDPAQVKYCLSHLEDINRLVQGRSTNRDKIEELIGVFEKQTADRTDFKQESTLSRSRDVSNNAGGSRSNQTNPHRGVLFQNQTNNRAGVLWSNRTSPKRGVLWRTSKKQ